MGDHFPDGWDSELDYQYDFDGTEDAFEVGPATPFTASDLAVQFITDKYGALWVPQKGIHPNSEVWKTGQRKGNLVIHKWCAEKKGLL